MFEFLKHLSCYICCSYMCHGNFLKVNFLLFCMILFFLDIPKFALTGENLTLLHAYNKVKDQPVHQHSLINTYVVCCSGSLIAKLATCEISLLLVSVAEQDGLSLA